MKAPRIAHMVLENAARTVDEVLELELRVRPGMDKQCIEGMRAFAETLKLRFTHLDPLGAESDLSAG